MKKVKTGSDFSGVGAFDQALKRLDIEQDKYFACDIDKYARLTYVLNYGEPKYYPHDVYDREIPTESLDIYMTSPPCQSFSLAGNRKGETDKRGTLFYNSHNFIKINKPRHFIFENVKGLLSDDGGKTFQRWVDYLGGKSVNGTGVFFPHEDSVPYHIYYKVLNAKNHGVPQNRERVFIVGIRDDKDNYFTWAKEQPLLKNLRSVLEDNVSEKYYLSDRMIDSFINRPQAKQYPFEPLDKDASHIPCLTARYYKIGATDPYVKEVVVHEVPEMVTVRKYDVDIQGLQGCLKEHKNQSNQSIATALDLKKTTVDHWFRTDSCFSIPDREIWSDLKKLLEIDTVEFDESITQFETKEGVFEKSNRVYDDTGIAPTITSTSADERILTNKLVLAGNLKGGKWDKQHESARRYYDPIGIAPTIPTCGGGGIHPKILQKSPDYRQEGTIREFEDYSPSLRANMGDNHPMVDEPWIVGGLQKNQPKQTNGISPCLTEAMGMGGGQTPVHNYESKIRKLTPTECFRLMDFNSDFKWEVSDTQAYKQAGNSIVVACLVSIIKKLRL